MAELSTVARPYAEALFEVARNGDLARWSEVVTELGVLGGNEQVRAAIADPKLTDDQIYGLVTGVLKSQLPTEEIGRAHV